MKHILSCYRETIARLLCPAYFAEGRGVSARLPIFDAANNRLVEVPDVGRGSQFSGLAKLREIQYFSLSGLCWRMQELLEWGQIQAIFAVFCVEYPMVFGSNSADSIDCVIRQQSLYGDSLTILLECIAICRVTIIHLLCFVALGQLKYLHLQKADPQSVLLILKKLHIYRNRH